MSCTQEKSPASEFCAFVLNLLGELKFIPNLLISASGELALPHVYSHQCVYLTKKSHHSRILRRL